MNIKDSRNLIIDIVEKINQEIFNLIEDEVDEVYLDFHFNGNNSIIKFLGIKIWEDGDYLIKHKCKSEYDDWDSKEFKEVFTKNLWEKINQIKELLIKISQNR